MRRCYLVCYDVCDPKRLRRVHRIMKGYGEAWQLSVFYCVLRKIDQVRLRVELEAVLNLKEDQVLLVDLGENELAARDAAVVIGKPMKDPEAGIVVI